MKSKTNFEKLQSFLEKARRFFAEIKPEDLGLAYKKVLKRVPDISHLKNIVFFTAIASLLIFVLFAQRFSALVQYLPTKPARGGIFIEGVVGEIEQINPLYTPTNPIEDSVAKVIFSGLTENTPAREVVGNLAESWEVSEDKKTYTFRLRDNLFWHDGERLDAEDVLFTFQLIQNPDVNSPRMSVWKDVKIETKDERTITFTLPNPLVSFIHLTDVPIVPKHILEGIPVANLRTAEFSVAPVGSGPFVFSEIKTIRDTQEVHLVANKNYHRGRPYINEMIIKSFPNYGALTYAYSRKDVMSVSRVRSYDVDREERLPNIKIHNLIVPEYDVLFYNLRSEVLKDRVLREAISLSIDKNRIVSEIYHGEAVAIHQAILPGFPGYNGKIRQEFNLEKARANLKNANYVISPEGKLQKNNKNITLRLISTNDDIKKRQAELVAEMIGKLGIAVSVESYPLGTYVEEMIRPRNFDLILVTKNLGHDSDIYAFYHGNMEDDPGLNLSGFRSRQIDKLLEDARSLHDSGKRAAKYSEVVRLINNEILATYISWPSYLYGVSNEVKGTDLIRITNPKDRFWNIEDWYIFTERDY